MTTKRFFKLLLLSAIATLVLVACGGGAAEPAEEEEAAPEEEEAMEEEAMEEEAMEEEAMEEEMMGTASIDMVEDSDLGLFLVDAGGMTLYLFTVDDPDISNCYEGCAAAWPPLLLSETGMPSAEGLPGTLGTIARTDDTEQITYNAMPLYYFARDESPGDTNGQGRGGVWFVVNPDPVVVVSDQPVVDGTVIIDRVQAAVDGWLVIHAQADGSIGPFIGWALVTTGESSNVVVEIDTDAATDTLYAMLHVDVGTAGEYEFPGDDAPVILDGAPISPPFNTDVDPSVTVADQAISDDGTVRIAEAIMLVDGWMVIHAEADDGGPGAVIRLGSSSRRALTAEVVVEIDTDAATDTLYAMLHLDEGTIGEYEFPGDDVPVILDGAPISPPFAITE